MLQLTHMLNCELRTSDLIDSNEDQEIGRSVSTFSCFFGVLSCDTLAPSFLYIAYRSYSYRITTKSSPRHHLKMLFLRFNKIQDLVPRFSRVRTKVRYFAFTHTRISLSKPSRYLHISVPFSETTEDRLP